MISLLHTLSRAYSGLSREVWWLSLGTLINRVGTLVIIFMALYLEKELHFSVQQIGVVMAMFGTGSFVGVLLSGYLIDRFGFFPVIVLSLIISSIMLLIASFITSYFLLCLVTFFISFSGDAFRPAANTGIAQLATPGTYTRSVALYRLAINLGFSIGPVAGGMVALFNYKLIFYADSLTCFLAAIIILIAVKPSKIERANNISIKQSFTGGPYSDKIFLWFSLFNIIYAMSFFQMITTISLYYNHVHHLSSRTIGLLFGLNGFLVVLIEMILISKIDGKRHPYYFIVVGCVLLLLNYLALIFSVNIYWLVAGVMLISFSEMFAMPFMMKAMMQRCNDSNRGQYTAMYSLCWSIAQVLCPLMVTNLIHAYNFNAVWVLFIILMAISAGGYYWLGKREKNMTVS
ncbi:MAG: MFS transporter [Bacteroidetes bacterium]|nr:MFS transporter [Bacteroidota bacterium]